MAMMLKTQKEWPRSIWEKVPSLLKDSDLYVRQMMVGSLQGQSEWPQSVWDEVPSLLLKKTVVHKVMIAALQTQKRWPQSIWDEVPSLLRNSNARWPIIVALQTQKRWLQSVWNEVPPLLKDPDISLIMVEALHYQREWPESVWEKVSSLCNDSNLDVRLKARRVLDFQKERLKDGTALYSFPANLAELRKIPIPDLVKRVGSNYGRSFGTYFIGSEVGSSLADLIISGIEEKRIHLEQSIDRLMDWKTYPYFAAFSAFAVGSETFLDRKVLSLFEAGASPQLKYFAKHGLSMAMAMELTSLSREILENPDQWREILDRHLSIDNMVHLAGVTTSFLLSRSIVQGTFKVAEGIRYGSKATSVTPPGLLASVIQEIGVFALVGLSEHYLLSHIDRAMLHGNIFSAMSLAKDHLQSTHERDVLAEEDLLKIEELFQYVIQLHMQKYIKKAQEAQKELQDIKEEYDNLDPRVIRAQDEAVERINQNPTSELNIMSDYGKLQESFLSAIDPTLAEKYKKDFMKPKVERFMEHQDSSPADKEELLLEIQKLNFPPPEALLLNSWDFPEDLSQVFVVQGKFLNELEKEAQGKPVELELIQKAQERLFVRKIILIQALKSLL